MAQPTDGITTADSLADPEETKQQIAAIVEQLTRVLFGDYTAVVTMQRGDPIWGNLAMHINVAINAARNAIARAEESEQQAARARDDALAAARAESRFLTNVSHELRTPLASIRASAEILSRYAADEALETRQEFADIILSESERLTRLIENVLDLGRIQAQQTSWDFGEIRIGDTVAEVVRNFNVTKAKHGVTVELRMDEDLPVSIGDRDRLVQLWTNLIGNAIKFSGDSDRVSVDVRRQDSAIRVEVLDAGIGIHPDDQAVIFNRFRQVASDTLTNKPGGTGLGLAISEEIAMRHRGEIGVESKPGEGSLFWVRLPLTQPGELEAFEDRLRRAAVMQ